MVQGPQQSVSHNTNQKQQKQLIQHQQNAAGNNLITTMQCVTWRCCPPTVNILKLRPRKRHLVRQLVSGQVSSVTSSALSASSETFSQAKTRRNYRPTVGLTDNEVAAFIIFVTKAFNDAGSSCRRLVSTRGWRAGSRQVCRAGRSWLITTSELVQRRRLSTSAEQPGERLQAPPVDARSLLHSPPAAASTGQLPPCTLLPSAEHNSNKVQIQLKWQSSQWGADRDR